MGRTRKIEVLREMQRPDGDRQFVAALDRGLRVLRAFTSSRDALSNGELSKRTGLSRPTVSRLTYTLARVGYLSHSPDTGLYRLGAGCLALGNASLADLDVRQAARPLMQELADHAPGGVVLSARSGLDMICLEIKRNSNVVGLGLEVGDRMPLALTAPGRAYLATLHEVERSTLLEEIRRQHPDGWKRIREGVAKACDDISSKGFCSTIGDWFPEFHSVAVPLKVQTAYGTLAVNIGGFASALPARMIEKDLGPRLVTLARLVDERMATTTDTDRAVTLPAS
jgi:DNA-binding IclR family transcriptional regulator